MAVKTVIHWREIAMALGVFLLLESVAATLLMLLKPEGESYPLTGVAVGGVTAWVAIIIIHSLWEFWHFELTTEVDTQKEE